MYLILTYVNELKVIMNRSERVIIIRNYYKTQNENSVDMSF